jgi:hypothetical protein
MMPPAWEFQTDVATVAILSEWAWLLRFPDLPLMVVLAMRRRLLSGEFPPCPAADQMLIMVGDRIAGQDRAADLPGSPLAVPDDARDLTRREW